MIKNILFTKTQKWFAGHHIELKKFKETVLDITKEHGKSFIGLNYVFLSDDELLKINQDYLSHDYYTDIITFDLSEEENEIEGEIYISIDRVKENAIAMNTSFENELLRVMYHGLLHLMGYLDKSTSEEKIMRAKEDECLNLYRHLVSRET